MDADAELDAALLRQAGVALDHAVLHLDGAAHGVDHAAEFDKNSIARALDHSPAMNRDHGIDQVAAQRAQPRQRAVFVRAGQPAISGHVRSENRRKFPGLAHGAPLAIFRPARRIGHACNFRRSHSEKTPPGAAFLLNFPKTDTARKLTQRDLRRRACELEPRFAALSLKSNRDRKDVVAALSHPPPDAPERRDAAGRARKKSDRRRRCTQGFARTRRFC